MSKLDELIKELCPDGVEYTIIDKVCKKISSGGTPNTSHGEYYNGSIPWLRTQEVDWIDILDTGVKITNEGLQNSSANWVPKNCVIVAMYGATAAKVAINKIPLTTNQACCNLQVDESKAVYRYVYYWLSNKYNVLKKLGQGSQSNINAKTVRNFPIPLPPLPVQREIVLILDNFTELTAELTVELTAELTARKKQYEFYRGSLLSFNESKVLVEWVSLGRVVQISSGRNKEKQTFGKYPVYGSTGIIGHTDNYAYSGIKILVARVGANCGYVNQVEGDYDVSDNTLILSLSNMINPRYAFHLLTHMRLNQFAKGGGQPLITAGQLKDLTIPLPPQAEQDRIVSILDKFDIITADLTKGLPAEIEARKKQFEYYRDKLLTFREVSS